MPTYFSALARTILFGTRPALRGGCVQHRVERKSTENVDPQFLDWRNALRADASWTGHRLPRRSSIQDDVFGRFELARCEVMTETIIMRGAYAITDPRRGASGVIPAGAVVIRDGTVKETGPFAA